MSRIGALCVSQPIEIRSTPEAAIVGAVSGVMRPEASVNARPPTRATAFASVAEIHIVEQHRVDFFIYFQPKEGSLVDDIIEHINQELALIAKEGVNKQEFTRAVKQVEVEHLALLENIQKQAYSLGKFYLAKTGDEQYLYTYTHQAKEHMPQAISEFVATYLRPAVMHKGQVLPLPKDEKAYWLELQELSDQLDQKILSGRVREEVLEGGRCVSNIEVKEPQPFTFPRAQSFHISNGLKVLNHSKLIAA